MERKTHTIDATGKVLGRLATEIAVLLRGKQKTDFAPYKDIGDFVVVKNAGKIRVTGKKMEQKKYFQHSGYLGNAKEILFKDIFKKNPGEVLRRAVYGMLPKNRLRAKQINRLSFE
ncbi:MAG: 50S ribosomal protein L13 [Candidatus Nealsonbacteria bacterium]|nr:50S ribosomal protein L13 [Candidatus Nealsonbacteria bacterium]